MGILLKFLHTSDWHLGKTLYGKKRYDEFEQFLDWLLDCIEKEKIDAVLISGDIFDNSNPSTKAIEFYFNFLGRVAKSRCQYVIVTAGNHDSPSLLNAPKELLRYLDIFAIGSISENIDDEVLVLKDSQNKPVAIVCAVPFLHDSEIRTVEPGEDLDDKNRKLLKGIHDHYQAVCDQAELKRSKTGENIPIIVMGHLFAAGGQTTPGDGVRDLYVGNLARVRTDVFTSNIDYIALGHLHSPQIIDNSETIRYSGAPLPMSFGEAEQKKSVVVVEFSGERKPIIKEIAIPRFQEIMSITGDFNSVTSKIRELKKTDKPIWLEITLNDNRIIPDVQETINLIIRGSKIEILKITNTRIINQILQQMKIDESLSDLNETDVFQRCLDVHEVPVDQRPELLLSFNEILLDIHQSDLLVERNSK